jgi:hypothetical protein
LSPFIFGNTLNIALFFFLIPQLFLILQAFYCLFELVTPVFIIMKKVEAGAGR